MRGDRKRGISHIEVITAFILFIGFVGVALYFFSPTNSSRLIESTLNYGVREVEKNTSVDVETYSIKIMESDGNDTIGLLGLSSNLGEKARAESSEHILLPTNKNTGSVSVNRSAAQQDKDFFVVRFSEGITLEESIPYVAVNLAYNISSVQKEKMISESRIKNLAAIYTSSDENYRNLKEKNFNLPARIDFGFSVIFRDGVEKISALRTQEKGVEVFSNSKDVEIIRENGATEFGKLVVYVW